MSRPALEAIEAHVGRDRMVVVSPDYFEVLGTDRLADANATFGPEFAEYRRKWSENPKAHVVEEFPLHVDVEVTNTCNLRCAMCQIPFADMERGFMSDELYDCILAEVREHHLPSIKFNFRGEPMMHPRLAEFVAKAKDAGVLEVQFNSNGSLLTEELSRALIEAGLDRIKFSIDAVTPEVYDAIRRGTTYEKTVPRVLRFIEVRNELGLTRPSVQVQMVYMEDNAEEALRYLDFWEDRANRVGFSRYRAGHNVTGEAARAEDRGALRFPCHQLWQRLVVLWDGTVLMCCGDHQGLSPLGNVNDTPLHELWHGAEIEAVRATHLRGAYDEVPACVDCEVNYL
ncbi:MAG: radical SAM protein [Actinobacteria bacterium]|nr:MAG: radical SAM protein [Actinomycetota bacterium]